MTHRLASAVAVSVAVALVAFGGTQAAAPPGTDGPLDSTPYAEPVTTVTIAVTPPPPTGDTPASEPVAAEAGPAASEPAVAGAVASDSVASDAETTIVTPTVASSTNAQQVDQDQNVVVTVTAVANANTGGNTIVDGHAAQGGSQLPAQVSSGDATAVGSHDQNVVTQGASVVLADQARANVVQVALIINIGAALANSGFNVVASAPGGSGTTGAIGSGDASATGLDIDQYITQAARESGDEDTDAHSSQIAVSLWMGVATANSGTNTITGAGVSGSGGAIGSGGASATGNDSMTDISQYAEILGLDASTTNVTQRATVLNVGFAVANSGLNDVAGVAGGLLSAGDGDDDAVATQLFSMLLPALLQSYGYGPAQGSITTGDATAVGNASQTFVRQVASAAASGDGVVDIVQDVLVANVGAAAANTGGNSLGSVRTLDAATADAVVRMAAFMAELLATVHDSMSATTFNASSRGIDVPFDDLILRLDGTIDGVDTTVGQSDSQANIRQVSVVVSLGVAQANSGRNVTSSQTQQGAIVNGLQTGDRVAVLGPQAPGNVIGTGSAVAGNSQTVVLCQRLDADDVDCLAPPTTTTTIPSTTVVTDVSSTTTSVVTTTTIAAGIEPSSSVAATTTTVAPGNPGGSDPASGVRMPSGMLPATGGETGGILVIAMLAMSVGGMLLIVTRRRL